MSLVAISPSHGESAYLARSPGSLLFAGYQSVPPAPGRETGVSQPAPAPSPASGGGASSSPPGGGWMMLVMVAPVLLMLLFSSRSQQKKQAAVIAGLKKGDRVLTQGGLVGRLVEVGDRFAKLEISPGVKVEVLKSGLLGADTAETQAAAEKK